MLQEKTGVTGVHEEMDSNPTTGSPRYSVLLTVYNRDASILRKTLDSVFAQLPKGSEVIVVDDGSTIDYGELSSRGRWINAGEYEANRIAVGYNNPARAFNVALAAARGERLVILSSDVIVPGDLFARLETHDLSESIWTPCVVNQPGGEEYCGPSRVFPMPWCLACLRSDVDAIDGWDEEYLRGQASEDLDFVGRLVLRVGAFTGDWSATAIHQAHHQPAYTEEALAASKVNDEYTRKKWGGTAPFCGDISPFVMTAIPRAGNSVFYGIRDGRRSGAKTSQAKANGKTLPHLFVGVPTINGQITVELRRYLSGLEVAAATGTIPFTVSTAEIKGIAPVEYARNVLCGMAIAAKADLAMLIDADMTPGPTTSRLLFNAGDVVVPRMYRFRHEGKNGQQHSKPELCCCATIVRDGERLDLIPELDAQGAHKIDYAGTGCIMIKRKVLEDPRMRVGPDEGDVPAIFTMDRNAVGRILEWEDVNFTRRATELGYAVVVDFAARCGHEKKVNLDSIAELVYSRPERGEKRIVPATSIMDGIGQEVTR